METASKLQSIKDFRRARIAALLDKYGKTELARLVDISANYLWQMGKGEGQSARGVSDANAAKIESGLGKPPGWMDADEPAPERQSQAVQLSPDMLAETHRVLREMEAEEGREFFLENEWHAARFVQVYEMRAEMPKHPSQEEWVQFGRKLAALRPPEWVAPTPPQGAENDGRGNGVPAQGAGAKKVAGRVRRKA